MINIFRVFLSDVKRLSSNVVAIVIIMGLTIIPALYAWFNIMSNWDVYGEAATSQMNIAVYSCDEGVTMGSLSVNVGDTVKKGQTIIILEAMKMENNINADKDGKITAINVSKGESVLEGTDLVIIE